MLTGSGLGRQRRHLDVPRCVCEAVRHVGEHEAGHALLRIGGVGDRESDGAVGQRRHVPDAVGPVVGAAVQGVIAVVLLRHVGLVV